MVDATIPVEETAPDSRQRGGGRVVCLVDDDPAATDGDPARIRETAGVLVEHGWEVTLVVPDSRPDLGVGSGVSSIDAPHAQIRTIRMAMGPGAERTPTETLTRLHDEDPFDLAVVYGARSPWRDAVHRLWDRGRVPYVLDHTDAAGLPEADGEHAGSGEPDDRVPEATLLAEAMEIWVAGDTQRQRYEDAYPALAGRTRVVAGGMGSGDTADRAPAPIADLSHLGARVDAARAMVTLLEERGASGPAAVTVFEIPFPTTRTVRMMDTLRAAGVVTTSVHYAPHASTVTGLGFRSIPFTNRKFSLLAHVQRHLKQVETAEPDTADGRLRELYQSMLDVPVPATRHIWQDLKIWSQEWFDVARVLVENPTPVFWAADLNALPPAVWAKHALPGTRVILDAHELFTELDYLDPTQRAEWEDISETFLPEVDLVITVGEGIADELQRRYGLQRVEVIESLGAATRSPGSNVRHELGLDDATPLVVHIGNVSDNRNPLLAVRLLEHDPRIHFAFVGVVKGAMSDTLRAAAESAGVLDRLHLVGSVPRDELQHFLSSADASAILYSPRTSENLRLAMPNKLFDALGAGVPCVAATGTTAGEYLERERIGLAFEDGDARSLAAALEAVLTDHSFRQRVRERAPSFLWPSVEPRLLSLVADELAQARVPSLRIPQEPTAQPEDSRQEARSSASPDGSSGTRGPRAGTSAATWRGDPVRRARRALAWRLRRAAGALER